MIIVISGSVADIYVDASIQEPLYDVQKSCEKSLKQPTNFLNLPTEIRLEIYHYYLLSLNLPDQFFGPFTMKGYWNDMQTHYPERYFNLSKRRNILQPLLSLLLLSQQIRGEVEAVLYKSFVFCLHSPLSSPDSLKACYSTTAARPAQQLRKIQINILSRRPEPSWTVMKHWRPALTWLAKELPQLKTVALAVYFRPPYEDQSTCDRLIDTIVAMGRIFKAANKTVVLQHTGVENDRFRGMVPASSPLCAEDELLLRLRDRDKRTWHGVSMHFNDPNSGLYSVTDLQSRYERLKVRHRKMEIEIECLRRLNEDL